MAAQQVSFVAGHDPFGNPVWRAASIQDREERPDGEWLCLLPAFAESELDAVWVRAAEVRMPAVAASGVPFDEEDTGPHQRLRIVR